MKMAKKLVAVLLAGVLALSVLSACSGSAGPLTEATVKDYILDIGKAEGYDYQSSTKLDADAATILNYVNTKTGYSKYAAVKPKDLFDAVVDDYAEDICTTISAEDGYAYTVTCVLVESYRTDLFNQGQTAAIAGSLVMRQHDLKEVDGDMNVDTAEVGVTRGTLNGADCVVALFKYEKADEPEE